MHTLTFTLRQHTPLIHFQHEQEGATLRASEVKPKLDKYIIKKAGLTETITKDGKKVEVPKQAYKEWFIGKDTLSLNYKIRVHQKDILTYPIEVPKLDRNLNLEYDRNNNIKIDGFPCYFGNLGEDNQKQEKRFTYSFSELNVDLQFFNRPLFDFLESKKKLGFFDAFFNAENFGTRQTKGFGSFTLVRNSEFTWPETLYSFDVDLRKPTDNYTRELINKHNIRFINIQIAKEFLINIDYQRTLFNAINIFHKAIKSGYNQNNGYFKSALFKYFKDQKKIQWDKKSIKEAYFSTELGIDKGKYNNDEVLTYDANAAKKRSVNNHLFLVRDLIGLSTMAEWKYPYSAKITKENPEIDRFKSPVTYKPVLMGDKDGDYFRVFIFLNPIPEAFFNAEFNIYRNGGGNLILQTPDSTVFNLDDYFAYLASPSFQAVDLIGQDPVTGDWKENRDTDNIIKYLNQLKTNA